MPVASALPTCQYLHFCQHVSFINLSVALSTYHYLQFCQHISISSSVNLSVYAVLSTCQYLQFCQPVSICHFINLSVSPVLSTCQCLPFYQPVSISSSVDLSVAAMLSTCQYLQFCRPISICHFINLSVFPVLSPSYALHTNIPGVLKVSLPRLFWCFRTLFYLKLGGLEMWNFHWAWWTAIGRISVAPHCLFKLTFPCKLPKFYLGHEFDLG